MELALRPGDLHRHELVVELERAHRLERERALELVRRAEHAAAGDPAGRSVREWCARLVAPHAAPAAMPDDAAAPGRQTLVEAEDAAFDHGEPLEATTRRRMEQAFGFGFADVTVHRASRLATGTVRALVQDGAIHFRRGAYRPGTPDGDRVIAHELAHVVQQRTPTATRVGARREIEREADRAAALAVRGRAAPIALRAQPGVAYAYADDEDHTDGAEGADRDHDDLAATAAEPLAPTVSDDDPTPRMPRAWLDTLAQSSGRPLPRGLRTRLEAALGVELGDVRVHDGEASDAAARAINARAFTLGKHIHFARGTYDPTTPAGIELIAHEVAHAAQHTGAAATGAPAISTPGDRREREAEAFARTFMHALEAPPTPAPRTARAPRPTGIAAGVAHRLAARSARPASGRVTPAVPGVSIGSVSTAIVHRDGGDGPPPPPAAKPKPKAKPPKVAEPGIDEGELAKKAKEANDPVQDQKDKEKFEKDNPQAPKDPAPIKPPPAKPPSVEVPKPAAKGGEAAPPAKQGGKGDKTAKPPAPAGKGGGKPAPVAKPPKQSAAEAAVCAAADADVAKFWQSAQKDPKAEDVSSRSAQIWAAAQALQGPGEADDMIGALNPLTAGDDLAKAWAGLDQSKSPYAQFNEAYRTKAMIAAGVRDVAFNVSNVLGKVGLILTVVGFILSLFGVGAILVTIGRVINIITLIMDVVAAVAGLVLVGLTAAQIKDETDPYKRAKLAKLLLEDCNKAASNVVNIGLANAKVGKVVGKTVSGAVKGLAAVVKFVGRPIAAAIKALANKLKPFFAKLGKSRVGKLGTRLGKGVGDLVRKGKANRAKVLAEVDARAAQKDANKARDKATKAKSNATERKQQLDTANDELAGANTHKTDADAQLAAKKGEAAAAKTELEGKKQAAEQRATELESARKNEKTAKQDARTANKDAKAAESARQRAAKTQKANADAATEAKAKSDAAREASEQATKQREASARAEATAKQAAADAKQAEQAASEAAARAREAADRAKATAAGDAQGAAKAAEDAQKAAADARKAADDLVTAQQQKAAAERQAQQAAEAAEQAAKTEKALADARAAAAEQAEKAAKAAREAEARAAEAQKATADAQAQAKDAQASEAAAAKTKAEADAALTERQRADAAKRAADEAAARKLQAEQAAAKAKADAQAAAEQKAAAEKAAADRAAAEKIAAEQRQLAEARKAEAAQAKQAADKAYAESQAKAAEAQRQKDLADAQVKKDQAEVAAREAALRKAEQDLAAKQAQETQNANAAQAAAQREKAAAAAKQAADEKLIADTKVAQEKAAAAATQKQLLEKQTEAAATAATAKRTADDAAKTAETAARAADKAAKDAQKAANEAAAAQQAATTKQSDAEARLEEAVAAKTKAEQEATAAQKIADDAQAHAADPDNAPAATLQERKEKWGWSLDRRPRAEDVSGDALVEGPSGYGVGQMQQELATKNDPRDNFGTDPRWDLDPSKMRPRAPRMHELRASSPRGVNVAEAVARIFAKKDTPAAQPSAPAAPAPSAPAPSAPAPAAGTDGGSLDVGPIPYWPELIQKYNFDLNAMSESRTQVGAYKAAQQKALQVAQNDLRKRAAEIRAQSAARKAPIKQNETGLTKDKANLDESKQGNQKQLDNDAKNEQEKGKADGPGQEGADAATQAAAAEPPEPKGWWGKIKAVANRFLKATLGRAMKFVTDMITNGVLFVIKHTMDLDIRAIANHGMTTADDGTQKANEGATDTTKADGDNSKVEADVAAEDMTLGQRIAAAEKNIQEAEAFEKTIDEQEKTLKAEQKAAEEFIKQVEAQFAQCKADAEAKPEAPAEEQGPSGGDGEDGSAKEESALEKALVEEAKTVCTGSIDAEIANLTALNASGARLLQEVAGDDALALGEAEKQATQIEHGTLREAIDALEALRGRVTGGDEAAVVAAADDIDAACASGTDALIRAYVAAEREVIAVPPAAPDGATQPTAPPP